jgi:hypothetical protein
LNPFERVTFFDFQLSFTHIHKRHFLFPGLPKRLSTFGRSGFFLLLGRLEKTSETLSAFLLFYNRTMNVMGETNMGFVFQLKARSEE